jgi:hypothetical protein
MSTPNGVNDLLQLLLHSVNFADFQITRIKSGRSVLCPYVCCYVTIRSFVLESYILFFNEQMSKIHFIAPVISVANIGSFSETTKKKDRFFRLALKICPSKLLCAHHNCFLTRKKLFPRLGTKNKGSCNIIRAKYWEIR